MDDIMKIIKTRKECGSSIKGVRKTIKSESKEQRDGFLSMLLCTLGASLLGTLLTGRRVMKAGEGILIAGEGTIRTGQEI